jgi:hypothetical protein
VSTHTVLLLVKVSKRGLFVLLTRAVAATACVVLISFVSSISHSYYNCGAVGKGE